MSFLHSFFPDNKYYDDDYCLLILLRGMCLKHMNSPLQVGKNFHLYWIEKF